MNKKLPKQKCKTAPLSNRSLSKHFYSQSKQYLTRAVCSLTIGSLVWFSGCASNPMQFLESMSQPTSLLDFPTNDKSSAIKIPAATKTKSSLGTETKSSVAKASYQSESSAATNPLQDETQSPTLPPKEPLASPATTSAPTSTPTQIAQPTDALDLGLENSLENAESLKMPDEMLARRPFPKSSAEIPCDTGPDTDTDITLSSIAFSPSTIPDLSCEPGSFASTGAGMSQRLQGGTFLNGSEFRYDKRTATEIAIMLKDQNIKLKQEKTYLKDIAKTLQKQLMTEQTARKLAETKFDEIQIENKDQRKAIAQLQLAYENLTNQKLEVEKEYDTKLREIEATLDKALLEAMYDASKKQ
ncbi:MAG: hypothetical protein GY748_18880 [Planctomycetaceae bacterium]|nr:hypothetical protein [Planctomycetaceae bacterium]